MSDDFAAIEDWAATLLARLEPSEQRRVNRVVAAELRRGQAARIATQKNPDGTAYAPRRVKKDLRGKRGQLRRKMFARLRTTRYLRTQAAADTAATGFPSAVARIARIHQKGLRDRPAAGQAEVRYAVRVLLGFTDDDRARILDTYLKQLSGDRV